MPQMTFDPPRYEWHAETAAEANDLRGISGDGG